MIRMYNRRPRFDDGKIDEYSNYVRGLEPFPYDDLWNFNMYGLGQGYGPYWKYTVPRENVQPPYSVRVDLMMKEDPDYNPYLDSYNYETYGDDYVNPNLPQQTELEQPAVSPQQVRANTRQATRPIRRPVTTAVQDRKAALKTYNAAVKAADKKAKAEVALATRDIKKANSTLKRNGATTYSLGNTTAKNHQLPEVVVTGNARKKNTSASNTRIGGYAGMGGSMWRPGQSQQKSNRGTSLINAIKGIRNAIGVASSKHKSNTQRRATRNRGWNAWSLGLW